MRTAGGNVPARLARACAATALLLGLLLCLFAAAPALGAAPDGEPGALRAQEEEDDDDLRIEGTGPMPEPAGLADTGPVSTRLGLSAFALLLAGASLVALGREPRRVAVLRWKAADLDGWDPMIDRWTEALRKARPRRARYSGWTLRAPRDTSGLRETLAENES